MMTRRAVALVVAACAWAVGTGCNAIFGIDELSYDAVPAGDGGSGGMAASCYDGELDGTETDVDCGGSCLPCSHGRSCLVPADCASGHCAEDGLCAPCRDDQDCAVFPTTTCNELTGTCTGSTTHGQPCNSPADCASGFCPPDDGICCDTPCALTCEACLGSKTGGPDGICDFIDVSIDPDPDSECPLQETSTCGASGEGCAADQTSCVLWPQGSVCEPAVCVPGEAQTDGLCDGIGSCLPGVITECGGFACNGVACHTTCSEDAHCLSTHFCEASSSSCIAKYPSGHSCTANVQCISGSCTTGYCA